MGASLEAFTELRFAGTTQVGDIDQAVAGLPEVVESFTISGDPDALVRLRVRDVEHLKLVIDRIRRTGIVTGTKTMIVLGATQNGRDVGPAHGGDLRLGAASAHDGSGCICCARSRSPRFHGWGASVPPLTWITSPVTNDARSDARYSTPFDISTGRPR